MESIKTTQDLNNLYSKVNKFINEYIDDNEISPSEVNKYIKKNMSRFLKKYKISDIEHIETVVKDVVDHRKHMEIDMKKTKKTNEVLSFSNFSYKINESIFNIPNGTTDHEKVLADYFETSVGFVIPLQDDLHLYEIKDSVGNFTRAAIYSSQEFEIIKKNIVEKINEQIKNTSITLNSLGQLKLGTEIQFNIGKIYQDSTPSITIDDSVLYEITFNTLKFEFGGADGSTQKTRPDSFHNFLIWKLD